jgi:nucleotide-binding universal stress UspA family protein
MTETTTTPTMPDRASAPDAELFVRVGGRIVVGVDGSPASKQALCAAARIAEITGGRVEAVAVGELSFTYAVGAAAITAAGVGEPPPKPHTEAVLDEVVRAVFGSNLPRGLSLSACIGNPAKLILEKAEGADLLVLGSRGHGALAGLLLGSVSTKCAAAAPCPVLIVHAPTTA